MRLNSDSCYKALLAHDSRFDGRFFVGVSSTGIYCRPVCCAKTPKRENCTFFSSAAGAESAGFRPCLRCRPELAPGNSAIDAHDRLARDAASLIEDGVLNESDVEGLARKLGVSGRHLRRIFRAEFGVSLVRFAQTHRLLLARRLLTDADLPVIEVAMASGFSSLRRFNSLFKERYGLCPSDLRRRGEHREGAGHFTFELGYHTPMNWEGLIGFLGKRAIEGVESVEETAFRRSVRIRRLDRVHLGWIEVFRAARTGILVARVSSTLSGVIPQVIAGFKRLFDLRCRPAEIAAVLGALGQRTPGLRVPGAFDGFEMAVRAILGQQITVKAARTVAGRFARAFGEPVASPFPEIRLSFPGPQRIAGISTSRIASIGIVSRRAQSILSLARAVADGVLQLAPGSDVEETLATLTALPGIGSWTAQYIAMRALSWPDAFPHTDYGVMKALGEKNPAKVLQVAEKWRPWRAYAVMHLWNSKGEKGLAFHRSHPLWGDGKLPGPC
jgi:AraC family transcriptional regulator, regulatory protein of adaptative response / DNA-3-methyladenine glycosylase II